MTIKHSKYRNTGLIFELLVKQIASDTLSRKNSPALHILRKYFTGKSTLVREFKLYELVLKNKGISQNRAESILTTITEISRKLDRQLLTKQRYTLIKELKEHYTLDEFFSIKVRDYKLLAAVNCLVESVEKEDRVSPEFLVNNRVTILEHLTSTKQLQQSSGDPLIEEFAGYDKDLRLLIYKLLLEKFNKAYDDFTDTQKEVLRKFIIEGASETRLRLIVNTELGNIYKELKIVQESTQDRVLKIKIGELLKTVVPIEKTKKVTTENLVRLLQYHELLNELA
jgi:hypothetical protein